MQGFSSLMNKTKQLANAGLNKMEDAVEKVRHHAVSNLPTSALNFGEDLVDDSGVFSNLPVDVPKTIEINGETYKITKLLGEGGFSFVFIVKNIQTGVDYALKRLLIQDSSQSVQAKKEIDVMKKLNNHENIVKLIGVKEIQNNRTNEIYILMELADSEVVGMMEERLNQRSKFSEQEILNIFFDVCKGVAHMHSQNPPMIHRDLKVENILCMNGTYKICDFGSTTTRIYTLTSRAEKQEAEEDIQKNTTLAYRAPEMADLYSGDAITEKADVWALGCVLFKLCFFKGPFEDAESSISVINAKYKIPPSPVYSQSITDLIKSMLVPSVKDRPSVFDIIERVGKLLGKEIQMQRPTQRPILTQNVQSKSSPVLTKPTTPKPQGQPQAGGAGGGDLFSQIDWFSNDGRAPSQQTAQPVITQQTQPKSQFIARKTTTPQSPAVVKKPVFQQPENFQNSFGDDNWDADFSDFDAPSSKPVQQPSTPKVQPKVQKPLTPIQTQPVSQRPPQPSGGGDLFSQLDWQEASSPVPQAKPPTLMSPQPQKVLQLQNSNVHKRSLSENFSDLALSPTTQTPQRPATSSPLLPQSSLNSEGRRLAVMRSTTIAPRQARPSQISMICNEIFNRADENVLIEYLVCIRERPVFVDPNVAVKAMILLHHIAQSLPDRIDPIEIKSLVQDLKEVWKPKNQLLAKFVVEYGTWLEKRCDIMQNLKGSLSSNFALKSNIEANEISELIDLLDGLMQLQKSILIEKTPSAKMGSAIPVTCDAYDLYLSATHSLQKCSEANKFSDDVKKISLKYNQVYTNLSRFVSQVGQFKLQAGNVRSIPSLQSTPPSFFGLQKSYVQPPSPPTAPVLINPNFEYAEPDESFTYRSLSIPSTPISNNEDVLRKDGNNCCADCSSTQVQWAHLGYGTVLCTQCRLAHFTLKTGRLESLTVGGAKLSKEQLTFLYAIGNKTANEHFELSLPPNTKPNSNINQPALQTYVRNKYLSKMYSRGNTNSPTTHIRVPSGGLDSLSAQQFYM